MGVSLRTSVSNAITMYLAALAHGEGNDEVTIQTSNV